MEKYTVCLNKRKKEKKKIKSRFNLGILLDSQITEIFENLLGNYVFSSITDTELNEGF